MVNSGVVNARSSYFRRRLFVNLFAFWAGLHASRIRLNIIAKAKLTIIRSICPGDPAYRLMKFTFKINALHHPLILQKGASAIIAP